MNTPIFNRAFQHPADGWYQIEAKGEHPNARAGVTQVIDDAAIRSIVDNFNSDAKAGKLRQGHEMVVDIEHFKDDPQKESRAYGWATELRAGTDGIDAKIDWTSTGKPAVDGGDYRFFSTEYNTKDCETVGGDPKRLRPLRLDGLTLTNMNNNRGQKPITNRDGRATEVPHQSEIEAGFPVPALEAWFRAVSSMQKGVGQARGHSALQPSYQQAWNLCKRQHPEMYIAAFGSLSADPFADTTDTQNDPDAAKEAASQAATITNRIKTDSGWTFQESWNFARSVVPRIFNRAAQVSSPAVNRQTQNAGTEAQRIASEDRQRAGIYFQRLIAEERAKCRSYDEAYRRVCNREEALHSLVCGRLTGELVFRACPDLFKAIYG